jgi:hypothetical protein
MEIIRFAEQIHELCKISSDELLIVCHELQLTPLESADVTETGKVWKRVFPKGKKAKEQSTTSVKRDCDYSKHKQKKEKKPN